MGGCTRGLLIKRMKCQRNSSISIVAIVVTYFPDLVVLKKQLDILRHQVAEVMIIDNGSAYESSVWNTIKSIEHVDVCFFFNNKGIASAQNYGINKAKETGVEFILLMDQDSLPAVDMVERLLLTFYEKENVAAVCPWFVDDRHNNTSPFASVRGLRLHRHNCLSGSREVSIDYLVSSGSLIPMSVFTDVGLMREEFFIDYVDTEWGLRAKTAGLDLYGVFSAQMQHHLGVQPLLFLGKKIPVHAPIRLYYQFRNAMLLYQEDWVPLNWKFVDGCRLSLKFIFFSICSQHRLKYFKMMVKGIYHGLKGRAGEYIEKC